MLGLDAVWALGVRNPWRSTFDAPGGMLFVADVGQALIEEVNAVPATQAGVNYGWNTMEGASCFNSGSCDMSGLTLPVLEYGHTDGNCSVTGGYVYRGSQIPGIVGHYFYSDFCTGFLRSFRVTASFETMDLRRWSLDLGNVSSFGVDGVGELYVVDIAGTVSQIVAS